MNWFIKIHPMCQDPANLERCRDMGIYGFVGFYLLAMIAIVMFFGRRDDERKKD